MNNESLSPRQQEIIELVSEGLTNRQIGRALGISEYTVKDHLKLIFARLGVENRAAAATRAVSLRRRGLPRTRE